MVTLDMRPTAGEAVTVCRRHITAQRGGMQQGKKRKGAFAEMYGTPLSLSANGQQLVAPKIGAIRRAELLYRLQPVDQRLIGALVAEQPQ